MLKRDTLTIWKYILFLVPVFFVSIMPCFAAVDIAFEWDVISGVNGYKYIASKTLEF